MNETREAKIRRLVRKVGCVPPSVFLTSTHPDLDADDITAETYIRKICDAAGVRPRPVEPLGGAFRRDVCHTLNVVREDDLRFFCEVVTSEYDDTPNPMTTERFVESVTRKESPR